MLRGCYVINFNLIPLFESLQQMCERGEVCSSLIERWRNGGLRVFDVLGPCERTLSDLVIELELSSKPSHDQTQSHGSKSNWTNYLANLTQGYLYKRILASVT